MWENEYNNYLYLIRDVWIYQNIMLYSINMHNYYLFKVLFFFHLEGQS